MQPDCLKGWVVCRTFYGDKHLKDILGSIVRVGFCIPVPDLLNRSTNNVIYTSCVLLYDLHALKPLLAYIWNNHKWLMKLNCYLMRCLCDQHVVDIMARMRREMAGSEIQITPQIDNLLILDRSADLITPLLSQLTYEGLLDEIFTIQNSKSHSNSLLQKQN